jgi:tetratricopeptide (TPR) repeat protein
MLRKLRGTILAMSGGMLVHAATDQCTATPLFAMPPLLDVAMVEQRLTEACVLAHQGQLIEAQDAFCEVLDEDAGNLDALLSLAQICRIGGHWREAVALLEEARLHHPDSADVIAALGLVALDLGYEAGARRLLGHLDRLAPQHPDRTQIVSGLASAAALA